jgi:hypothetical protein
VRLATIIARVLVLVAIIGDPCVNLGADSFGKATSLWHSGGGLKPLLATRAQANNYARRVGLKPPRANAGHLLQVMPGILPATSTLASSDRSTRLRSIWSLTSEDPQLLARSVRGPPRS